MAIRALNPFAAQWYTPAGQEDDEAPARFKVRGLDGSQQAEVAPEIQLIGVEQDVKITGLAMAMLLRYGLVDWEGFENSDGPVRFGKNAKLNQNLLPYDVQVQLAGKIFELTFNPDEVKKKSS